MSAVLRFAWAAVLFALLCRGQEGGNRDRKQDADDKQDDQQLDQGEALVNGRATS